MSATNRGSIRQPNDFYPTPGKTLKPLLRLIDWDQVNNFLEPCKGNGIIIESIQSLTTKLVIDYCEITEGADYLKFNPTTTYDLIITNPPFSSAEEFLEKSLQEADCVCYLLRLNFLGSQKRKSFWNRVTTPEKLLVLSERPSFTGKGTDATEYAWFCWDKHNILNLSKGIHIL